VREQFSQIFAVIIVVLMDVIQEKDQPVTEVDIACLATSKQRIDNSHLGYIIAA